MNSNKKENKAIMKKDDKDQNKEVQDNNEEIKNAVNLWAYSDCGKVCYDMSGLAVHISNTNHV